MTRDEVLILLSRLESFGVDLSASLAALRTATVSNPNMSTGELKDLDVVRDALVVVASWVDAALRVLRGLASLLTDRMASTIRKEATATIKKIEQEASLTDNNRKAWQNSSQTPESWGASIVLRARWLVDWMRRQLDLAFGAPYKMWVSRLAPNTCRFCRGLHGVVIPMNQSFRPYARRLGWTRFYGGLYAPGLHPNCLCRLIPISREEYDRITDTNSRP